MDEQFNIPKKNPYKVPTNYFDELPVNIEKRISQEKPQALSGSFFIALKPQLKYALVVVILISGTWAIITSVNKEGNTELTSDVLAEMLIDDPDVIDEQTYIDFIIDDESGFSDYETNESFDDESEEIIDYLIDYDIDEYMLLAEL